MTMDEIQKALNNNDDDDQSTNQSKQEEQHDLMHISGMYKNWFLDYASYVILERAVPYINDGLKPVQRRILYSMKQLDDGRYNKVANIIGHTMQYHPHGDASIGDALVQLGQKELLIDMQGNWGNSLTGDNAAAPRYIEARLSKFAIDVVFNPKTTNWKSSYDGRNKEPLALPVKFPLLLAQGVEGIAVGLASKILPHNFNELIDASINHLREKDFEIFPDFLSGGMVDVSRYNDGLRGGKIKVRAKINKIDKKTLAITEIPFGKTTSSLIESVVSANEKGKIKIKKIDDNTAAKVEIIIKLLPGTELDKTIDALYAFTDCEVSISPNSCTILDNKPIFVGVKEMLKTTVKNTVDLIKLEQEIRLSELKDAWHFSSLEKIFIENRIYLNIEDCETWKAIVETIDKGLEPFKPLLKREVVYDDIVRLTEIKIKRISKFDAFKADEYLRTIEEEMEKVKFNIEHIIDFSIDYYQGIKRKYGKGKERKTEIRNFDTIVATKVIIANEKLYVNYDEGFIGTALKKDVFISDCSDIDDFIVFLKDGRYIVDKVSPKTFVGKNIIHAAVFKKNDARTIYNAIYLDGKTNFLHVKRFAVTAVTRDREYNVTKGNKGSDVLYFTANNNGEAETVKVIHKPKKRLRKLSFEFDFSSIEIKGRNSMGNILTRHAVHKIAIKEHGISTLGGREIWFDNTVNRLNTEKKGEFLGEFKGADNIIEFTQSGYFKILTCDLLNRFENDSLIVSKFDHRKIYSAVFWDGDRKNFYLKRFAIEQNTTINKPFNFINEHPDAKLIAVLEDKFARIEVIFGGDHTTRPHEIIDVISFIGIKSFKAKGKRISTYDVKKIKPLEPIITEEEIKHYEEQEQVKLKVQVNDFEEEKVEQVTLNLE